MPESAPGDGKGLSSRDSFVLGSDLKDSSFRLDANGVEAGLLLSLDES